MSGELKQQPEDRLFYRRTTDGLRTNTSLANFFAGPTTTACWIIGGGPSLLSLPIEQIAATPVPKFAVNLAGTHLLRPTFWTSYDPTARFHRSVYLDASITKFVHSGRAMDLVPGTTFKVCDCPGLLFFDRDRDAGFSSFPGCGSGIVDWQDSLIQAIDIAYRLGFRELYLAGCDMQVLPSEEWLRVAAKCGVQRDRHELLGDFARRCEQAGMPRKRIESLSTGRQYHFEETKPLRSAINTDFHYFRVAQYLRLSRRSLAQSGLQLISVTPESRLNDDFQFRDAAEACRELLRRVGDPRAETTRGRYTNTTTPATGPRGPMRDFRPHFWTRPSNTKPQNSRPPKQPVNPPAESRSPEEIKQERRRRIVQAIPEIAVNAIEEG